MWISGNVDLEVVGGCKTTAISKLEVQDPEGSSLPKGDQVNFDLVNPDSSLRQDITLALGLGGNVRIGQMRVVNGGGFYSVPAPSVDFAIDGGSHDKIWEKVCKKMGAEPVRAHPVVFRDLGAPGTYGVFDGGGAGRGERIPQSARDFIVKHCLAENFGEIGMMVHYADGRQGRVSYRMPTPWLDEHVAQEWQKAHKVVPIPVVEATPSIAPNPDKMVLEGVGTVNDVRLAFEFQSASLECLVRSDLELSLEDDQRLRFIDLESRNGSALNRRIGIVLETAEGRLAVCSFNNGQFDPNFPILRLTDEVIDDIGNDKFRAVINMIRSGS